MNPDPLNKVDDGDRGVGVMWITVDRCSDLLSADRDGLSDPQVKLSYEEMSWMTTTVQNDLSPVFDEDFRVPLWTLPSKGDPSKRVVLEVTDEDDYFGMKVSGLQV
jgi:Ca2+-dependent lipid-binding protein